MKFKRRPRYESITLSQRKIAAFARKQANERGRYPLFADHIASEQTSLEYEAARRENVSASMEQSLRDFNARVWRSARSLFQAQPEPAKAQIRAEWAAWTGPRDSTYFSWHVDRISGEQEKRLTSIRDDRQAARAARPALLNAVPGRLF